MVNTDEGEPKHIHEKAKGCVSKANTDEGRTNHTPNGDEGERRKYSEHR
jgi:hypothetical protein